MIKCFQKLINNLLIPIMIGIAFCLTSCNNDEVDLLDLALNTLKPDLNEVNKPLNLTKHIFFKYNGLEYNFDVEWTYDNEEKWKSLTDYGNYYVLEQKEEYDDFYFNLNATIRLENEYKSKTFSGHYVNKNESLKGIDLLYTLDSGEEITLEGMAINIYKDNCFVFYDGMKSITVEETDNKNMTFNVEIELVLKVEKNIFSIGNENVEKIIVKYVNHHNIDGSYGEKENYKINSYNLEKLYNLSKTINMDNYNELNYAIVQTNGYIEMLNGEYFISVNDISLKISNVNSIDFAILMLDCVDSYCTVDLYVDFVIENNVIVDYVFYVIDIIANIL